VDSGLYKDLLGLNLFTYCYNDPVNYVDMFGESAEAVLYAWMTCGGAVAAAEPTPIGDIIYLLGLLVIGIVVECDDAEPKNYINPIISANDWSQSDLIQDSGNKVA